MTEYYIMCYCYDIIEADDKERVYKLFCEKHKFTEVEAELVASHREVEYV